MVKIISVKERGKRAQRAMPDQAVRGRIHNLNEVSFVTIKNML